MTPPSISSTSKAAIDNKEQEAAAKVAAEITRDRDTKNRDKVYVEMLDKHQKTRKRLVYSLDIVDVSVGETVTWLPKATGHNVHFISGPNDAILPKKSKVNKEFRHKFDVPGVYLYQCTPHKSMGMIGLVVVGENTTNKDAIAKIKVTGKSRKKLAKLVSALK